MGLVFNKKVLATSLVIIAAISVASITYNLGNTTENKNLQSSSIGTHPISTVIVPQEKLIGEKTFVVGSAISTAKFTTTNVNHLSANSQFILPWIKQALAISGISLTVTSTEWVIPTTIASPKFISANSTLTDVYFTEDDGNKIGRLVPLSNDMTEWTVPTASSRPFGMTTDSSGSVYFTEFDGNKVGRLVPSSNVITEWTVPTASSGPESISTDSFGNVYFTELTVNKVGRLVPSTNVITEWTVPTAGSGPLGLSTDSSGSVYFTELNVNKIGRLS